MSVTISGDTGVSLCDTNSVPTTAIQSAAVAQTKLGSGVAGNGPAFSAYLSSLQSVTSGVNTKITFQTKEFDTASSYDNATNYRFQPNVAGYYQVNAASAYTVGVSARMTTYIYKNGSEWKRGSDFAATNSYTCPVSALVYLNGSTDYVEIYTYQSSGSTLSLVNANSQNFFQAALMRAA